MMKRQDQKQKRELRTNPDSGFCVGCGTFYEKITLGQRCAYCGTIMYTAVLNKDNVKISINWQELTMVLSHSEAALIKQGLRPDIIYSIADRIEKQYPLKPPLTVKGYLSSLKMSGGDISKFDFPSELLEDLDLIKIKKEINWNG